MCDRDSMVSDNNDGHSVPLIHSSHWVVNTLKQLLLEYLWSESIKLFSKDVDIVIGVNYYAGIN